MVTGISLEEAVVQMTGPLSPLGTEILPLERALSRTLAADVAAPLDQPPFDRSPLDGYALRSADLAGADRDHPAVLEVVDTVPPCWRWWTRCTPGMKPESPWAPVRRYGS